MTKALLLSLLVAAFVSGLLLAFPAYPHGHHDWMRKYSNGEISCCDKTDIAYIPHWEANAFHVGDTYRAVFPSGPETVEILKVYPTEGDRGRAAISKWGCLFRAFGL